jgi:hypothetical protein
MALQNSNTTCDVYRSGNAPPAAPDVAGVKIFLTEDFATAHNAAVASSTYARWTHLALMAPTTDIRDGYGTSANFQLSFSSFDTIYVPDKNGQAYQVLFVARAGRGTPGDIKKVYLQRQTGSWPTNNL